MPSKLPTDKDQLRQRIMALSPFPLSMRADKSARICEAISRDPAWLEAKTVAIFAAQLQEPEVELLYAKFGNTKGLCFPKVSERNLKFYRVNDPATLQLSKWNLREPADKPEDLVDPGTLDLILVPGIAFTRTGKRLGRGGGYYDRLLSSAGMKAIRIGVCFERQVVAALPTEPHDIKVDRVVTETGFTSGPSGP